MTGYICQIASFVHPPFFFSFLSDIIIQVQYPVIFLKLPRSCVQGATMIFVFAKLGFV